METKKNEIVQLHTTVEGRVYTLNLPAGCALEEAKEVALKFAGSLIKAWDTYNKSKDEDNNDNSSSSKSDISATESH